jgi:hypothetical protein
MKRVQLWYYPLRYLAVLAEQALLASLLLPFRDVSGNEYQ